MKAVFNNQISISYNYYLWSNAYANLQPNITHSILILPPFPNESQHSVNYNYREKSTETKQERTIRNTDTS
jgi:hypothetical protein